MRYPNGLVDREELISFEFRCAVFGSRKFDDKKLFHQQMCLFLKDKKLPKEELKEKIVFLTDMSPSGPAQLIKSWCIRFGYHWCEFIPKWDEVDVEGAVVKLRDGKEYNAMAGMWRDLDLADASNEGITFYDGASSDAQDKMMTLMRERMNPMCAILVDLEK